MTDSATIITAMTKAIMSVQAKSSKGILLDPLEKTLMDLVPCTQNEFREALLRAVDEGVLEEELGWVKIVPREVDFEEYREQRDRIDNAAERKHDAAQEWARTG